MTRIITEFAEKGNLESNILEFKRNDFYFQEDEIWSIFFQVKNKIKSK